MTSGVLNEIELQNVGKYVEKQVTVVRSELTWRYY